jgi:hypothetical protein
MVGTPETIAREGCHQCPENPATNRNQEILTMNRNQVEMLSHKKIHVLLVIQKTARTIRPNLARMVCSVEGTIRGNCRALRTGQIDR